MSVNYLSDMSSVFQLYVALGVGFSTILDPFRFRVRYLTDRLQLFVDLHTHEAERQTIGASERLRFYLDLLTRLKLEERATENKARVVAAFAALLALLSLLLLIIASTINPPCTLAEANAIVLLLTIWLFAVMLFGFVLGRAELEQIRKEMIAGPALS